MTTERAYYGYERALEKRLRAMNIYMDGKWEYPPICSEAANEIERLRDHRDALQDQIEGACDELDRLRSLNSELAEILEQLLEHYLNCYDGSVDALVQRVRAALAKVQEGK